MVAASLKLGNVNSKRINSIDTVIKRAFLLLNY